MVHIYYGYGKGKTTAAFGLAIRCAGGGGKVLIFQFLKDNSSGERNILDNIPDIDIIKGREKEKFVFEMSKAEINDAKEYYVGKLEEIMARAAKYDMVILDEIIAAVECGLIDERRLIELIEQNRQSAEIVMTGHSPSEALILCADYVTEMKKIKHPFDNGLPARKLIEY